MTNALDKYYEEQKRKESIEHQDALLSIAAIIKTDEGRKLFKYLFKSLDVMELPEKGIEGFELHDYLGFLRAGNSIYKLACQAASESASDILAKIERERYDDKYERYRIENGFNASSSDSED